MTCPKCGSENVQFSRENMGEVRNKKSKQVIHQTVGLCKDCGFTWTADEPAPKKRKTWLWALGWLFIFPVPLTILMLRKNEMKPALKYGVIIAAWALYLLIGFVGSSSNNSEAPAAEQNTAGESTAETVREAQAPSESMPDEESQQPAETEQPEETQQTGAALSTAEAASLLELVLKENFGENYTISTDENTVTVNVWSDGVALGAAAAASGDQTTLDSWNNLIESMKEMANSQQSFLDDAGADAVLVLNVVNDANKENILAVIMGGVVWYDAVNNINLLG